ncbi:uncharacterized protein LOC113213347 isoform X1 [Frankliniella occidentalis]|uniref:Uncharacterized protein LOC113213347 isoform X1 n=1 Tax=Frankliniella occidentalis TaxID=133901 RepID=A0A6J1T909_FRAOC|nr:uncharacterized protein LOC113213347 isoform X1 [Frankliniella occidentalis]XP_026288162.1 uncharacterized protein LOC113213347 isoform X1 [Frankliniella occidentalis]XP_052119496.1 uncharacterized protein LOC113213347 isoform X1 [Frankliniella occidentalis]
MSDQDSPGSTPSRIPFKIVDYTREKKFGIVAGSLEELVSKACEKLEVNQNAVVKIVLDIDGTEVDDEEYFETLESNTVLMLLIDSQRWLMHGKPRGCIILDETDGRCGQARQLVERLHSDMSYITMLGGKELEMLTDMDPESLSDIDRTFVEQLQQASGRFLAERREAQDALHMLKLYNSKEDFQQSKKEKV